MYYVHVTTLKWLNENHPPVAVANYTIRKQTRSEAHDAHAMLGGVHLDAAGVKTFNSGYVSTSPVRDDV